MADITVVQSDDAPSLFGTLTDAAGDPFDLTDATVRFQMRLATDRRFAVDFAAVVVDAEAGSVRYDWQDGDLAVAGAYAARWRIAFLDGSVEHTAPENTVTVSPQ